MIKRALAWLGIVLLVAPVHAVECDTAKTSAELDRGTVLARYRIQPWETLQLGEFASAYRALTRNLREPWIRELSTGSSNRVIDVKGRKLLLVDACKQRVCASENIHVLFDPATRAIAYRLREGGLTTTSGDASLRALAADGCLDGIGE